MKKNENPIIVEEIFRNPVEVVWNSITKVDLMRQWYFENIPAFKAEVGFKTQFNVISEGRSFYTCGRILK